jgi:hypothetical protein
MIVVIPSARTITLSHLGPLIDAGARFIVVDDGPGTIDVRHPQFEVHAWSDQDRVLGELAHAIPRRNGACRDYGFFLAWRDSDPGEIVVALDDDCVVERMDFVTTLEKNLSPGVRSRATGTGRHMNVLDVYADVDTGLFPRGFPYSARAAYERFTFDDEVEGAPMFNLGLWQGTFDVNAIDKLNGPRYHYDDAELAVDSVVVPPGVLVSACSMNMAFRRELVPAVYQLPMHVEVMPHWVVDRYGDIWGGFILKTLMDRRGDLMVVGSPMIRHVKSGDIARNMWQEHVCHLVNDEFIALLTDAGVPGGDYVQMMGALASAFDEHRSECTPPLRAYLEHLVPSMCAWLSALVRAA